MAKKKNGNKMWIAGAVLGAVAGAAYALWKTPMSGQELRGKLASGPVAQRDEITTATSYKPGAANKILSKVEQTLAPIVGVELGKTANGNGLSHEATAEAKVVVKPASPSVASKPQEDVAMTKSDNDPKFDAADAAPDPGRNAPVSGNDSIRAKRFAWGSPTPEAGVQPVPTEPMEEDPVTEPALAREPATPAKLVPPGEGGYGKDTIRASRFAWGEPAPDSTSEEDVAPEYQTGDDQPRTDQLATAGSTTVGGDRPLEAVSGEAATPQSKQRKFPKLGGLE